MTRFIANARMYAVAPEAEAAWQDLLAHVAAEAGVALDYEPYPAPQPLEELWRRPDLGAVQMCGYPIALKLADVVPLAAPIPALPWAEGRAVYRSDFIVRADSSYQSLEETFSGTFGWTVPHSHSGFNAPRHHLLGYRTPARPVLFRRCAGNLVTARRILDSVRDGSIDIGPLDAYWHALIALHRPELTTGVRVLASTALAPMPAFVASAALPAESAARLRDAFVQAATHAWFPALAGPLCLSGFTPVAQATFIPTLAWHEAALAAGYDVPA